MQTPASSPERPKLLPAPRLVRDAGEAQSLEHAPRDAVDAAQLFLLFRRHWLFVALIGCATFLAVMAATFFAPMQFRTSGRLYLGELDGSSRTAPASADQIDITGGRQGDVWSDVEIISSRALVTGAILKSGLNADITPAGRPRPRFGEWLLSRRDPRLVDAGARELRVTDAALGEGEHEERNFRVKFGSAAEYELWQGLERVGQGRLGEPLTAAGVTLTLVAGNADGPRAGREYELRLSPLEDVLEATQKALDVTVPKASSTNEAVKVISLSFRHASPLLATSFLTALLQGYLDERRAWKTADATAAEAFITEQLKTVRASLEQIETRLANYRTNNRAVVLDNEAKALIEQVGKYEEQRVAARLQVAALTDIQKALKNPNAPLGAYLLGEAEDSVLEGLATSLTAARQKLTDLDARYNPAAPELRQQRAQVDAQLDAIKNYVSSRLSRARENQAAVGAVIGQFEERLRSVPGAELGLTQLSRESEVYGRLHAYLLERQQEMAIVKASTVSKNRVLDAPLADSRPDSPRLLLRLASGPAGILLGMVLVVLRALLSDRFESPAELARAAGPLPLVAKVPRKQKRLRGSRKLDGSFELAFEPPEAGFEEAFRTLRTNLYALEAGATFGVVLLTSPRAGDGKTVSALSLAALLSADGKRTLVVDADLRRPTYCTGRDEPCLETVLRGESAVADAVHRIASVYGEFDVLGAASPASPELLSGGALQRLLGEARNHYDFVLLDAPPFPQVSDALLLAKSADVLLSVIKLGSTPRRATLEHLSLLSSAAKALAIVANFAPRSQTRVVTAVRPHFPSPVDLRSRRRAFRSAG
jgi:tyrosine-protein kinase Etk/Wzc